MHSFIHHEGTGCSIRKSSKNLKKTKSSLVVSNWYNLKSKKITILSTIILKNTFW